MKFLVNRKIMHTYNLALDAWAKYRKWLEDGRLPTYNCINRT